MPIWMATFKVIIRRSTMVDKAYYWIATTDDNIGIEQRFTSPNYWEFSKPEFASEDFKRFAEANLISNYSITSTSE